MQRIKLGFLVMSAALLPIAAAGCGDDGKDNSAQAKAFCNVAAPVKALSGVLKKQPAQIKTAMEAAEAALATVSGDPPVDIAADVKTVQTTFTAANAALKTSGYDTAKVDKAASAALSALEDPAFSKAGDAIQAWTTKNC